MRRKQGTLVPLERSIIEVAVRLHSNGISEFYGFQIAKEIKGQTNSRSLTGYGTLYRALGRLEKMGYLSSRWERSEDMEEQSRPRRRFYTVV